MFNKAVITARGLALDAKVSAGQTNAVFTAVKLGNGIYSGSEDLNTVIDMKSIKQSFGISSILITKNNMVRLRAIIDNVGVEEGYYISELGIYAQDPDYGEILYSIALGTNDKVDYQPSEIEIEGATSTFDTYVVISNAENVTIKTDTGAAASANDLEELRKIVNEKASIIVMEEDIPVSGRGENTWYLKVTNKQTAGTGNNIKISPTMGLNIISKESED